MRDAQEASPVWSTWKAMAICTDLLKWSLVDVRGWLMYAVTGRVCQLRMHMSDPAWSTRKAMATCNMYCIALHERSLY